MTLAQKLTFVGIAIAYMSVFTSFSVLAPFFPYEAQKKGVNPTETGLVFGIFSLVSFIACPICGKYLPVVGGKFMFLSGSFVAAGCNILFGVLDRIDDKTMFLTYCFVIRTVEALGSAATLTAGMAICSNVYPENVAQVNGFLELFLGLGFAIGPPLGSLFYGIGGYELPFIVLGCTSIVLTILNIFIIPSTSSSREEDGRPGSVLEVLKIPAVWLVLITVAWGSASYGFFDPTLALHLTSPPLSIEPSLVGVMFLMIGGTYALFAPVWGYVADKTKTTRLMMALGSYFTGISYLLVGPSPLLNLPSRLWIVIVALGFQGCICGICIMPALLDLFLSVKWYGHPDDLATQSIISGLFNAAYSLGSFIGPTAGGALVEQIGFVWTSTYIAGGCFVVMIMVCLFGVWEFQCGKGRRKPSHMKNAANGELPGDRQNIVNA
ncbi:MFS-type transporter SLC18B1 [Strongylocentrotus purpuratus]|uniref:Major facilitator superfamily (MFS) profile domain-containing protein n=1 Tax=Strongylocentrotus purpuratus TaxID=7668 RepID=A0A7M7MZR6_STRPU|nr:MFS-type transporter SLC18B1 [Strongylocentrotus purpuratus]